MESPEKKPETLAERTSRLKALRLAHEATQPPPAPRDLTVYDLDTEIDRGKHKGETVGDVIAADPGYVRWMG